jgi:redox-sensitive bicupin YhaK (pirin superfamily)
MEKVSLDPAETPQPPATSGDFSNAGGGNTISIKNESDDLQLSFLPIAGVSPNEAVARYRPFVMNELYEIRQVIEDYRCGIIGKINF